MDEHTLRHLIAAGETATVAFRSSAARPIDVAVRMCGMANHRAGGVIIFGIEDATRAIVGIRNPSLTNDVVLRAARMIRPPSSLDQTSMQTWVLDGQTLVTVSGALADHIVERITFSVNGPSDEYAIEALFPPRKRFPQKEIIAGSGASLYDQVQKDSKVEEDSVAQLNADPQVIFYFTFPPAFKLHFPKVIGNYNPDWGIARRSDSSNVVLHLVRETKGSADLSKLQFPHERRKIECAQKIFRELGVSYRHVTGTTAEWRKDDDAAGAQTSMSL